MTGGSPCPRSFCSIPKLPLLLEASAAAVSSVSILRLAREPRLSIVAGTEAVGTTVGAGVNSTVSTESLRLMQQRLPRDTHVCSRRVFYT